MVSLEDFDDALETRTRTTLGETITYTPSGGAPLVLKAIVEYDDQEQSIGGSRVIGGDCAAEVPVSEVPTWSGADELLLPRRPGQVFLPKKVMLDETGMNWLMALKKKPA